MAKAYSYIRFSTPDQLKGDSLRRQTELSRQYAESNDLEYDESFTIKDLGISAYKSSNAKNGALGVFLEAVKKGRIEKGSYLLIESLDRLSRDAVYEALSQFMNIINDGIVIVTLSDNMTYQAGALKERELMYSLMSMSRAHEESRMKGTRIAASWSNKRKNSRTHKLTARAPAWLKLKDDRSEFLLIEERVKVIRLIFAMTINGYGKTRIIKKLNQLETPRFGRGVAWNESYVSKVLRNRAVLGEFQPHNMVKGKRTPCGEPVAGYFPAVVDESTFYKAKKSTESRRTSSGPTGNKVANLFKNIIKCSYCGHSMRFQDKGKSPKSGGKLIICSAYIRGMGCSVSRTWKYDSFEKTVLANLVELDIEEILESEIRSSEISALKSKINEVEGSKNDCELRLNRILESLQSSNEPPQSFIKLANQLEVEMNTLDMSLKNHLNDLDNIQSAHNTIDQHKQDITGLLDSLKSFTEDDLIDLRTRLSQAILNLVEVISVYTMGDNRIEGGTPPCYKIKIRNGGSQIIEQDLDNIFKEYIFLRKLPEPVLLKK
jgi:DNA invertase Pin-like site-specific DNA recombinase